MWISEVFSARDLADTFDLEGEDAPTFITVELSSGGVRVLGEQMKPADRPGDLPHCWPWYIGHGQGLLAKDSPAWAWVERWRPFVWNAEEARA